MKRQFLEEFGLGKEQIDSIMAENGKDIESAKDGVKTLESKVAELESENTALKGQVSDRDKQLETLKASSGDNESLKKQIEDLQKANKDAADAHAAEIKQLKIDAAVETALTGAKAKNHVATKALLADVLANAELGDDGKVKGLEDAIKKLQGADDSKFLFEDSKKQTQVKGAKPGESGNEGGDHGTDTSKMTYSELSAYLAEHPDAEI